MDTSNTAATNSSAADIATSAVFDLQQYLAQILGSNFLSRLIVGIIVVVTTIWITHLIVRALNKALDAGSHPMTNISFFGNMVRGVCYFFGLCILLEVTFQVDVTTLIAALGIGGIAISLGAQDTLKNLIGGVAVMVGKVFAPGDNIKVGSFTGVVQDIDWRYTTLLQQSGETVLVPNSNMSTNSVTILPSWEKCTLWFTVTSDRPLERVTEDVVAQASIAAAEVATITRGPEVLYTEITDEGPRGKVMVWTDQPARINDVINRMSLAVADVVR